MSNGGFILGGKTAKQLGLIMLRDSQRPILSATRDYTMPIPGRNGTWDFGADLDSRYFVLECAFNTRNSAELQARTIQLGAHLIDSYGRPRDMELRLDNRPNQFFIVRYAGDLQINRTVGLGKFALPLMAADPFAYGPEQLYETTITTSPFVFDIESKGNVRTSPVIVLTNTGANTITGFTIVNEYQLE